MVIVISNIAIFIPLVLVVFRNHIGIKDRCEPVPCRGTDHRAFPILVVVIVIANPDGQVRKSLALKIGILVESVFPLTTEIEVVLAKGSERCCCQKQQAEKKGYFIFHNH